MVLGLVTGLGKFFFLLWEIGYSYWRGTPVYTLERTLGTLGCELLRALMALLIVPLFVWGYSALFTHYSLFSLAPSAVSTWALAVVVFSFLDYWSHRWSHSVPFLWAIHSVHHQVEELNAIAGGRVSFLNDSVTLSLLFFLAVLGIPLSVTLSVVGVFGVYSAVLHCPFLGSFGWVGKVVASPAFHRLHHGTQPQYLDKNFSITLSFWDRVFGTWVDEDVPPKYGMPNGFATNSPFRANWQPWVDYFARKKKTFDSPSLKQWTLPQGAYLLTQMGLVLYCASFLNRQNAEALSTELTWLVVAAVLGSLASLDGLVRGVRYAKWVEGVRVVLFMPGVFFLTATSWSQTHTLWNGGAGVFYLAWLLVTFRKRSSPRASSSRRTPPPAKVA